MKNSKTKDFIAYEYLSLNVKSEKEPLYIACYENLGWILINNTALVDKEDYYINNYNINNNKIVNLKFKRDRKIKNKVELQSLQRKLEASLKELEKLEKEPNALAISYALGVGLLGTIFLAISMFFITATNPMYIPGVIIGLIGLVGWGLGYLTYRKVKINKEHENVNLIEEEYNDIYNNQEQARKLLD